MLDMILLLPPRFLRTMETYDRYRNLSGAADTKLDFLETHPATPRRIQLAISQARKVDFPNSGMTDRNSFLKGIDGIIFGETADEGYIRANRFIHPKLGITFSTPSGFTMHNSAKAVIASAPGDLAIRFDSVLLYEQISSVDYIRSGWVSGLDKSSIYPLAINGFSAASAQAENAGWQFDVTVIIIGDRVYRFLTASAGKTGHSIVISRAVLRAFLVLSAQEKAHINPLRIRIVTVKPGESVSTLAAAIQGLINRDELFRIINGLKQGRVLLAGDRVKIISE